MIWEISSHFLNLRSPVPPSREYYYASGDYPHGAENSNPDENVQCHSSGHDQSVPCGTGDAVAAPTSGHGYGVLVGTDVAVAIGNFQGDFTVPRGSVRMGRNRFIAGDLI